MTVSGCQEEIPRISLATNFSKSLPSNRRDARTSICGLLGQRFRARLQVPLAERTYTRRRRPCGVCPPFAGLGEEPLAAEAQLAAETKRRGAAEQLIRIGLQRLFNRDQGVLDSAGKGLCFCQCSQIKRKRWKGACIRSSSASAALMKSMAPSVSPRLARAYPPMILALARNIENPNSLLSCSPAWAAARTRAKSPRKVSVQDPISSA